MFSSSSANQKKKTAFEAALEEHGLSHCFSALKGSEGAVQLQHVMKLKTTAQQGEAELANALREAGVTSAEDQKALAAMLRKTLQAQGRLHTKEVEPVIHEEDSDSWKTGLASMEVPEPPAEETTKTQVDAQGETWPAGMKIVNGHLAQSIRAQGMLQEGNGFGYIHLAAEIEMPSVLGNNSKMKTALLEDLKLTCKQMKDAHADITRADVFDAFIIPPGSKEGRKVLEKGNYDIHVAEFDTVILIECPTPDAAAKVRASQDFANLKAKVDKVARFVHCITATNTKQIADCSKETDGIFLFNYFFAADMESKGSEGIDILKAVWEYTAGWWTMYANLDNSTPLLPLGDQVSQYSWINHCRWDKGVDIFPHLMFRPSMDQFVLKNFTANDIMAMPVLYHLA